MFTRSMFQTDDMLEQHNLLTHVAHWIDSGRIQSTLTEILSPINAANLRKAHAKLESGRMIGKLVLTGWNSKLENFRGGSTTGGHSGQQAF
jgi:NADPH:quinone reductase-like Zn-dependent oxidoreductase